jgi:hypothetical protein
MGFQVGEAGGCGGLTLGWLGLLLADGSLLRIRFVCFFRLWRAANARPHKSPAPITRTGVNVNNPYYQQYLKLSQIHSPAETFVFIEEHPENCGKCRPGGRSGASSFAAVSLALDEKSIGHTRSGSSALRIASLNLARLSAIDLLAASCFSIS